jgi:transposase
MIALQSDVRVYLACGYTDMRKGMQGLAMLVQRVLADPFNGALYAFRGRRGNLLKLVWHDGLGLCMLTKRLERGHFIWPMTSTVSIALSAGQLSTLLEGCEWRATARNLRPELAGGGMATAREDSARASVPADHRRGHDRRPADRRRGL